MGTAQKMAEALAARIKKSNMRQVDIAKGTDLTQGTISNVSNVAPNMNLSVYGRITDYLDRMDKRNAKGSEK